MKLNTIRFISVFFVSFFLLLQSASVVFALPSLEAWIYSSRRHGDVLFPPSTLASYVTVRHICDTGWWQNSCNQTEGGNVELFRQSNGSYWRNETHPCGCLQCSHKIRASVNNMPFAGRSFSFSREQGFSYGDNVNGKRIDMNFYVPVTGKITNCQTGDPIPDVGVQVVTWSRSPVPIARTAYTGSDGVFVVWDVIGNRDQEYNVLPLSNFHQVNDGQTGEWYNPVRTTHEPPPGYFGPAKTTTNSNAVIGAYGSSNYGNQPLGSLAYYSQAMGIKDCAGPDTSGKNYGRCNFCFEPGSPPVCEFTLYRQMAVT
jgi:hypothetical protein